MKAKSVEHFLSWRKSTNQAGTHKFNRLSNSDTPIMDKQKYQRGDLVVSNDEGHVITTEDIKAGFDAATY